MKQLYGELASSILNVECFFNVLLLQTPTSVIFAKLTYDYETDQISTTFNDMRGYFGFPDYTILDNHNPLSWFGDVLTYEKSSF